MTKATVLPAHDRPISAAQLIAAAGIEAEARGLATRGRPAADETELAKSEAAASEIIRHRMDRRHDDLEVAAHRIRAELAELPDARTDGGVDTLQASVMQGLDNVFRTFDGTIRTVVDDERTAQAQFNAYVEKHGHQECAASYPDSKIQHFAIVLVLTLIEAAGNAVMYIPATSNGIFGGFVTALLVAVVNVGTAVFAGYVPARYLNWHDLPPKQPNRRMLTWAWAIPALIVAAAVILGTNLFAAHFRDVAISSEGAFKERQVLEHLLAKPFELSLASFGLLAAGLLCALIAAYKGYSASDRYPGYEQEDRRYIEKKDDRDDLKVALHGHIDAVRQTSVDGLFNRAVATQAALEGIRRQDRSLQVAAGKAARLDATDSRALADTLTRFRRLNIAVRTDGVTPGYFATIDLSMLPTTTIEDLTASIEAATEAHVGQTAGLLAAIATQRQRIAKAKDIIDAAMPSEAADGTDDDLPTPDEVARLIEADAQPTRSIPAGKGEHHDEASVAA